MEHPVRAGLQELVERYGKEVFQSHGRFEMMLDELCPGAKRECLALVAAVKESIAEDLLEPPAQMPQSALIPLLVKLLEENYGFGRVLSWWAVETLALAIGLPFASVDFPSFGNPALHPLDLIPNSIGLKLKLIQKGSFMMGSNKNYKDEKPVHEVTISKPFYLGIYPVTQKEYARVMCCNPAFFKGLNRPVDSVSWFEAVEFCKKLSIKENQEYRLPTEAEWEYACRAGTTTDYYWGDQENDEYCWNSRNSNSQSHPVGRKKPNGWGLYDMIGNIKEWCFDELGDYPISASIDPTGAAHGSFRVLRGGSWYDRGDFLRSAYRLPGDPSFRHNIFGFRVGRFRP